MIDVRQLDGGVVERLEERVALDDRSLEGEVRHILQGVAAKNMAAQRAAFLAASNRLRRKTEGRVYTPAEVPNREDRADAPRASRCDTSPMRASRYLPTAPPRNAPSHQPGGSGVDALTC